MRSLGQRVGIADLCNPGRPENNNACTILLDQMIEQIGSACSALGGLDAIVFSVESIDGSNQMIARVLSRLCVAGMQTIRKTNIAEWPAAFERRELIHPGAGFWNIRRLRSFHQSYEYHRKNITNEKNHQIAFQG